MSRRRVRPDELELWQRVAGTTERLHPERRLQMPDPVVVAPAKVKAPSPDPVPIEPFEIGHKANGVKAGHDVLPGLPEAIASTPVKMDRKAFGRLKRGKLTPEGRIDLHGMTLAQAHPALNAFIARSYAQNKRLVLVITGKGKDRDDGGPIPVRLGILRHNVPHWLQVPPLAQMVLQVSEAHGKHGGGGAYYVYLRRRR